MDANERFLAELDFVALDLETTGLSWKDCRIVEFGAVRFRLDGTECGRFDQLVDPQCPIPYAARCIHGISGPMVRGKPTVSEVLPRFLEFFGSPATVLMAHNARFDLGFLNAAIAEQGIPCPTNPVLDTVKLARRCLPRLCSHSLAPLVAALDIARGTEHRGLSDSCLVMKVFLALIGSRPQLRTAGDLLRLSPYTGFAPPPGRPRDPAASHETLAVAIREGRTLTIVYDGGAKGLAQRKITPRVLRSQRGCPCLTAFCHVDQVEKTYRMDRIMEVRADGQTG